jgi:hypothetical protein
VDQGQFSDPDFISGTDQRGNDIQNWHYFIYMRKKNNFVGVGKV